MNRLGKGEQSLYLEGVRHDGGVGGQVSLPVAVSLNGLFQAGRVPGSLCHKQTKNNHHLGLVFTIYICSLGLADIVLSNFHCTPAPPLGFNLHSLN